METHARKRAREQRQGTPDAAAHQPAAHDTAAAHEGGGQQPDTDDPPTHILSLPHHLISSLILPRVSEAPTAFLVTCKAAHSMSSTQLQADWLQQNRPATALYAAARSASGSEALMLELLNRPGVPEKSAARDPYGNPLLVYASIAGYSQAVRVLLQRGVDPNKAGKYGCTPLMAASLRGHASVVQPLLQAGSPVNARSPAGGFTPLHLACMYNHPAVVQELLQCADVNTELRNTKGNTARDLARNFCCEEIVSLLEQHALRS